MTSIKGSGFNRDSGGFATLIVDGVEYTAEMIGTLVNPRTRMRELLRAIFMGWQLHEASWDNEASEYTRELEDCMTEACGDKETGVLLYLFSYWSNDIQAVGAHFGVAIIDGKVVDIAPAPSPEHWWDCETSAWREPEPADAKVEVTP